MDWKEVQETTKVLTEMAAEKLNAATDMATLHLRLKTMEYRRRALYEEFGKASYTHFTSEDGNAEQLAKFVEAITLINRDIDNLREAIRAAKEARSGS